MVRKVHPATEGPEAIGEILSRLFIARGWGRRQERMRLEDAWRNVTDAGIARRTRVGRLYRGVLEVMVDNAVLLQELTGFHKRALLEAMRQRLGQTTINDIRFRVGTWEQS
jgi:predicted nucleic acid-binding Zn ribbon protein